MAKGAQQMTRQAALMSFCQNGKLGAVSPDLFMPVCRDKARAHQNQEARMSLSSGASTSGVSALYTASESRLPFGVC